MITYFIRPFYLEGIMLVLILGFYRVLSTTETDGKHQNVIFISGNSSKLSPEELSNCSSQDQIFKLFSMYELKLLLYIIFMTSILYFLITEI